MDLSSRVVLLTGAKRIGASVAQAVASRGADVAVAFRRSREEADAIVAAVTATGRRALAVQADVSDPVSVATLIPQVDAAFGRLDVLVNMASLYDKVPFDSMTEDH